MAVRSANLSTIQQAFSALGVRDKVAGGAQATQVTRDGALYSQMRAVPHGRRVVCQAGLNGQGELLILDGADPSSATQIYPEATVGRVMARSRVRLTPGYVLDVDAICLPSGPSQYFLGGGGGWEEDLAFAPGHLEITASYDNGGAPSAITTTLTPTMSMETFKGLPTGDGAAWPVLEVLEGSLVPDDLVSGEWVEGVVVDITIEAFGSCRPIDVVVYERPNRATHDDTHREATVSLASQTMAPALEWAITGRDPTTDDRFGSHQANKTMDDQRQIWGPVLALWSAWNEFVSLSTVEATKSVTSTTFVDVSTSLTTFDEDNPGWSTASGGYARQIEQSGLLELRDVNGTIPVTCRVYARVTNVAYAGVVRFQTANYALRDVAVGGSTTWAWYSVVAWIRVPVHAALDGHLQLLAKVDTGGDTLEVRYAVVEFGGHFETTG